MSTQPDHQPDVSPVPEVRQSTPIKPVPKPKHHRLRWTIVTLTVVLVIALSTGGWLVYRAISVVNIKKTDGTGSKLSWFDQFKKIVASDEAPLAGESEDRVNVLLLGIGGPGHDGPYLTDTMIVLSYRPSKNDLAMLSIPRDLVVQIPGRDYRKINSVLSAGRDMDYPGGGEALAVRVVSGVFDIPIHYYARIDFKGFEEVIDTVNGVQVDVERPFRDNLYPDSGYGYDPIAFEAGRQTMDGALALKYARSRHGNNGENTDFARAARQQKILFALKERLVSFGTLANPKRISDILASLGSHSQTNMEVWEMFRFAKLAGSIQADSIVNVVLDSSPNGLLKDGRGIGGAYILVPKTGTYDDVQFLARNIFLIGEAEKEQAGVQVVNATAITGLAETASRSLAGFGLQVEKSFSLSGANLNTTVVLDNSNGRFPNTKELLRLYRRAKGSVTLAQWEAATGDETLGLKLTTAARNTNTAPPGLLLILGRDQSSPAPSGSQSVRAMQVSSSTN